MPSSCISLDILGAIEGDDRRIEPLEGAAKPFTPVQDGAP
jgi:hypothetical protein